MTEKFRAMLCCSIQPLLETPLVRFITENSTLDKRPVRQFIV